MERSGGVTAAGVVLLAGGIFFGFGAGMFAVGMLIMRAVPIPMPTEAGGPEFLRYMLVCAGIEGLLALWAILTAVGIFRLRNWARISMLIVSGLMAVFATLMLVSAMSIFLSPKGRQIADFSMPEAFFTTMFAVMSAVPLGCAIWWLILFLRKSVRMQFQAATMERARVSAAGAVVLPQSGIFEAPVMLPTPAAESAKLPDSPTSVLVIAIWLVATAPMALLGLPWLASMHFPSIFLGVLVTGWKAWALVGATLAFGSAAGIGLLLKKTWAIDWTIGYAVFTLVNSAVNAFSPATGQVMDATIRAMPHAPGVGVMRHVMQRMITFSFVFSILLAAVALYFLVTRRREYLAACAARSEAA